MASLIALSSTISTEAERLATYITTQNLPNPSFAVDGPPTFPVPLDNEELQASRMRLLTAAQDLAVLALGPVESLRWQAWNQYNDNISLHAIMHFRLAEAVPLTGSTAFADVAFKAGLDEALVTRLLRHAMIHHVFYEPVLGRVAHTVSSTALYQSDSVKDWLDMTFEEWGPASVKVVEAMRKFPGSQEPSQSGFGVAFDNESIFQFLAKRPERAKVFGSAMGNFSKGVSHKVEYLVKNYDWKGLGAKTVVDIGGSHGHISLAIAKEAPALNFVIEDLPGTVADGEKMLDPAFKDRVTFIAHDMNNLQPVKGAAVYLFRSVLLNWPDKYCVKFLQNLLPALEPGARVVINEGCLPEPGEVSPWDEKLIR
ncbi:hypothetical protein MMC30_009337 [Trapelia coarctata]|nr:hypothetical protein [Trapelia coarctata]